MYKSLGSFDAAVRQCGNFYFNRGRPPTPTEVDTSYFVYQKARADNNLSLSIAGRLVITEDGKFVPATEDSPGIEEIMMTNFGVLDEESDATGSILNASQWSILINDSWLLGVVHSGKEIHFASPVTHSSLWNDKRGQLTVMGREVVGIVSFGYRIFETVLEPIATRVNPRHAEAATFVVYMNALKRIVTKDDLERLLTRIRK